MKMPKCECGTELQASISYDGADWMCEAGEDSGYEYVFALECPVCPKRYPMLYMKNPKDISPYKHIKLT